MAITTKNELLDASSKNYEQLLSLINNFSKEDKEALFLFEDRDKNIRDVIMHLHEWHNMLISWHHIGCIENQMPITPKEGYTWRDLPALNREIWKQYQTIDLQEALKKLESSHHFVMNLIVSHTQNELFDKKVYKWTKTSSLAVSFRANMSSHYNWAIKKIKKQKTLLSKNIE